MVSRVASQLCNAGPLGNNHGGEEFTVYKGLKYSYSGYYGDGTNYGNEWVRRLQSYVCVRLSLH